MKLLSTLYPFQQADVEQLERWGGNGLLGSEVGTGKSHVALAYIARNPKCLPVVLTVPAHLKLQWQRMAKQHIGMDITILSGTRPDWGQVKGQQAVILNHDILHAWVWQLQALKPNLVIADEAHAFGGNDSRRTWALRELLKGVRHFIPISGTPINIRPIEFWPLLNLLDPEQWPNRHAFGHRFCKARRNPWSQGWDYKGCSRPDELHKILVSTCFPYNTLVFTNVGDMPIGEIVENEKQVLVRSYDHATNELRWRPIIAHSKRKSPSRLVHVVHEAGEFVCTPDHLVWSKGGYRRAESLDGHVLLSILPKAKDGQRRHEKLNGILLNQMCSEGKDQEGRSLTQDGHDPLGISYTNGNEEVRRLRQPNQDRSQGDKILFNQLREEGNNQTETTQTQSQSSEDGGSDVRVVQVSLCYGGLHQGPSQEKSGTQATHMLEKLRALPGMEGQKSGGESSPILENFQTRQDATQSPWLGREVSGVRCDDQASFGTIQEGRGVLPTSGHSSPIDKTGDRGGRDNSQHGEATSRGQVENFTTEGSRVVGVTILQRGDRLWPFCGDQDDHVYDIEVAKDHNFFADGVLVHNCMIRRLKKDVLKDLPEKMHNVVPLRLSASAMKKYRAARGDVRSWLKTNYGGGTKNKAAALERVNDLRQLTADLKLPAVIEWVKGFLESGEKLILFAVHRRFVTGVQDAFGKQSVMVHGGVNHTERQARFDDFNHDRNVSLLSGNIEAAGTGWSCTSSSNVAIAELPWRPPQVAQATGRVHGIGRGTGAVSVTTHHLLAEGTHDEAMCESLREKEKSVGRILDGEGWNEDGEDVFDSVVQELMR